MVQGTEPYILAEVVGDGIDSDRDTTLASALVGVQSAVVTREELRTEPWGRKALDAWFDGDDTEYDRETAALRTMPERPHLELVRDDTARRRSPEREEQR